MACSGLQSYSFLFCLHKTEIIFLRDLYANFLSMLGVADTSAKHTFQGVAIFDFTVSALVSFVSFLWPRKQVKSCFPPMMLKRVVKFANCMTNLRNVSSGSWQMNLK